MENQVTNRMGFSFPWHILVGGVAASIAGIIAVFQNPILGAILSLAGAFIWSSSHGVQIDFKNRKYREYGSFFFIKRGSWKPLDKLHDVTILTGRTGTQIMANMAQVATSIDDRYEVCLLNENHRRKIVIQKHDKLDEAKKYAALLAAKMNSSVVKYAPVISEKTRSRR